MKLFSIIITLVVVILFFAADNVIAAGSSLKASVERGAKTSATTTEDGIVRIGWQRNDVPVRIDGIPFPPAAGLGSWAAFKTVGDHTMVMGDTVVFEDEITPVIDAAFSHGLAVTALHNHFIYDDPSVYFMHISGQGGAEKLAEGVKAMWDAARSVRVEFPMPQRRSGAGKIGNGKLDVTALERILETKATVTGDLVKFTVAREGVVHGVKVGGSMGLTTWAAFIGDDQAAAVDGDFMMNADEVQPVMHALRRYNIHIVALHNHMIGEETASYFLHFWGRGPAQNLADGIRYALAAQAQ